MFVGTFHNIIDAKNRMIVPAKHRESLGNVCIVTRSLDTCLNIYSREEWDKEMKKIEVLPTSNPKVRAFVRHFCGNAADCEIDKQGRINIPASLLQYAEITKDLVTVGALQKIEVWSKEVWETPSADFKMTTDEFAETLEKYNF